MSDARSELKQKIIEVIKDLLPSSGKFALIDFPDHENIGDSAIYLGEIALFQQFGLRPSYVSTIAYHSWSDMERAIADGPIFIHGGGNFGDIWPYHNAFHEEVLRRYRDRKVIQLPQTIHYQSTGNSAVMRELTRQHPDFTLLVRDQTSLQFAQDNFKADIRLCPDMAFMISDLDRSSPSHELLLHLRTDQEAANTYPTNGLVDGKKVIRQDWPFDVEHSPGLLSKLVRYGRANLQELARFSFGTKDQRRENVLNFEARQRVSRGTKLLTSAKMVITDRLHGHILCTLLGLPHCILDNNYGKIRSFSQAWGTSRGRAYPAASIDEAIDILKAKEGLRI